MPVGFRILPRSRAVAPALIERFRKLPVANVSDSMSRIFAAGPTLRPMHKGGVMAGPAFTVRSRPGDNLMVHKAIDIAEPGDIVVVDAGGDLTNAIIGELMLAQMVRRKLGGIVINGAIRDLGALSQQSFPVYAAGVTHRGPYKDGPGEINVPISMGGLVIEPGDLILGDEDGFVSVAYADAEKVCAATEAKHAAENKQMAEIEAGTIDRAWVDATLRKLGCEGV
ncbi:MULTISPECIES: RraA family protein [Roseomonadaceae]|uniref:Putative 4-hydroxy-4-methyl-2-oxoglutarate aldolase n=1 Tax=Falsiroseomonas oleicola TaxID=2801474 RepID=A0ABS6HGA4_9PROT|nr:RraA family protein [Roseomonas oleicola]MBU8546521.1 RraA family protein [Roseomonas oleicola]